MNEFSGFKLFEEQASSMAGWIDLLFFLMVSLSGLIVLGVSAALIVFAIQYRRGSGADRSQPLYKHKKLEYTWMIIPLVLFIVFFVWSAFLYNDLRVPPRDTLDIHVVGKQWMWRVQHPQGRREINALHVPLGKSIRLVMTSEDVIHSFFIPAFRVKQDAVPGRYTTLWFNPIEVGEFPLFCAEYCGTYHSRMTGKVVVMQPNDYEQWLRRGQPNTSPAQRGAEHFQSYGCSGCHGEASTVRAPELAGLFGKPVPLADGGTVIADERYLRDAILLPNQEVVAGYPPVMPSYQSRINEAQLLELIAYIKSLEPREALTP